MGVALFLGKFQPFHKGHLAVIKRILKENEMVIIAIGSAQYADTEENPLSADERIDMIKSTLKEEDIANYTIVRVDDIHDDERYVAHVEKQVPVFDTIYTGNELVQRLFKQAGYKIVKLERLFDISATKIRKAILEKRSWQDMLPGAAFRIFKEIRGPERIKRIHEKK